MRYHEFLLEYDRAKAMAGFGGRLQARLQADSRNKNMSLEDLFAKLEQADPSSNKQYVNWMARAYQNGSELEDLTSRGADSLAKLDQLKLKKQIKPDHADVSKFKTLPELEAAMDQYQVAKSEPKADHGNYKELVNNSNVRVIQWFDETAAKYYGQGTKWCTAAERDNMANSYLRRSYNLFVFIPKKPERTGEKYQLALEKSGMGVQLMNEKDTAVRISTFNQRFPEVYAIPGAEQHVAFNKNLSNQERMEVDVVTANAAAIRNIRNPSEQVQLAAVTNDGSVIGLIENPSERVQLAAVQQCGSAIEHISNPSERVQLAVVKKCGELIALIGNPSERVQLAAIHQNPLAIERISNPTAKVRKIAEEKLADFWRSKLDTNLGSRIKNYMYRLMNK